jgi:hypothetical protein
MIRFRYSLKNGPERIVPFPEKLDTGRKRKFAAKDLFNLSRPESHLLTLKIIPNNLLAPDRGRACLPAGRD